MKANNRKIKIKKGLLVVIFLLIHLNIILGQYQIRSYDLFCNITNTPGDDHGRSIINRIDDGYAIVGYSYASMCGIGPQDWMFIKLESSGLIDTVRLIGSFLDDRCNSVVQSVTDTGYVLAGYMTGDAGKLKAALVKLDKNGGLSYSKKINNSYNNEYKQVVRNFADRWTFAGYSEHYIALNKIPFKILVTNYNPGGQFQWGYKYVTRNADNTSNVFNDVANSVCFQSTDSSYCVAGKTSYFSSDNNNYDIMVVKISPSGSVIWNKIYRFNLDPAPNYYTSAEPRKIIALPDGGFVIVGSTNVNNQNESDIIVMKISSKGAIVWSRVYGDLAYNEYGESVVLDGDLIVTGARKKVTLSFDVLVMKIPIGGGAPMWVRRWDPNNAHDYGYDIVKSYTGAPTGYAVTGESNRSAIDPFLMRVNSIGQVEGQTCLQTILLSSAIKPQKVDSITISRVSVTDISVSPSIITPPSRVNDICINADNPNSSSGTNQGPGRFSLEQNFPNPFNPVTKIAYQLPSAGYVSVKVFDLLGKEVVTLINEMQNPGQYEVTFDAANFSSGVYLYKLSFTAPSNSSHSIYTETKKMLLVR